MSGTYEEVSLQASRQLMIDQYWMVKEHQRWALAMPPFFNLIFIAYEMVMFFWYYRVLREKNNEGGFWDLLDGYLSRNNSDFVLLDVRDTAEDNYDRLRLMSFMERAKASYLEEAEQTENKVILDIQSKLEHLSIQVERPPTPHPETLTPQP